jgi:hypothetical protein
MRWRLVLRVLRSGGSPVQASSVQATAGPLKCRVATSIVCLRLFPELRLSRQSPERTARFRRRKHASRLRQAPDSGCATRQSRSTRDLRPAAVLRWPIAGGEWRARNTRQPLRCERTSSVPASLSGFYLWVNSVLLGFPHLTASFEDRSERRIRLP